MGLFKPAWMNDDISKALKAVERIKSQSELSAIALSPSASFDVRLNAIKKLKKPAEAIQKLTNQDLVVAIADYRKGWNFTAQERLTAIERIADHSLSQKLSQEVYNEIATSEVSSVQERLDAADKLMDRDRAQVIYLEITKIWTCGNHDRGHYNANILIAAAERLADQDLAQKIYIEVAKYNIFEKAQRNALEKLTDQKLLADFARTNDKAELRIKAAEKLIDQSIAQDVYIDIAKKNIQNDALRKTVVARIMDLSTLSACERDGHKWAEVGFHDEEHQELVTSGPDFMYEGVLVTNTYTDYKCEVCGIGESVLLSSVTT